MNTLDTYIASGIIENYCMGNLSAEQSAEVAAMAIRHPEVQAEIVEILAVLEQLPPYTQPRAGLKEQVLNFLEPYLEPSSISLESLPLIHFNSNTDAWNQALKNIEPDLQEPGFAAHVLKQTTDVELCVVWLSDKLVEEAHDPDAFHESFLILEGACECDFGGKIVRFSAGDYFDIPPNTPHVIKNISTEISFVKGLVQRRKAA